MNFSLSLVEWLSVTGLAQCIFILVYILFRVRSWRQTSLTIGYFIVLTASFALQFSLRLEDYQETIRLMQWMCWSMGPPICYLMVIQVAKSETPRPLEFWVMILSPLAVFAGFFLKNFVKVCGDAPGACPMLFQWLYWLNSLFGTVCMLLLWGHKDMFGQLWRAKGGRDKYWLVMALILANIAVVVVNFMRSAGKLGTAESDAVLAAMGLAFAYLVITTMFRVYTPPVVLNGASRLGAKDLSLEELAVAEKVKKLMEVDKLYHEPAFSRADLARELQVSENALSRIINAAFSKSFPRLLSEFRVEDAKRMLQNPDIAVQVTAFEVGFNSLASFNRVFKEITGITPTQYREKLASKDDSVKKS